MDRLVVRSPPPARAEPAVIVVELAKKCVEEAMKEVPIAVPCHTPEEIVPSWVMLSWTAVGRVAPNWTIFEVSLKSTCEALEETLTSESVPVAKRTPAEKVERPVPPDPIASGLVRESVATVRVVPVAAVKFKLVVVAVVIVAVANERST